MAYSRKKRVEKNETATREFKINDVVFAKLTGYALWPAQITEINTDTKKYTVSFFGTYNW